MSKKDTSTPMAEPRERATWADMHLPENEHKIENFAVYHQMVDDDSIDSILMLSKAVRSFAEEGSHPADFLWKIEYALFSKTNAFEECVSAYIAYLSSDLFTHRPGEDNRYKVLDFMAEYLRQARARNEAMHLELEREKREKKEVSV